MIRVDFYSLSDKEDKLNFCCRLIEKAYKQNHRLHVECQSQKAAFDFDDLLWGFKQESFIPHNLFGEGPTPPPPVQIGYQDKASTAYNVLINLSEQIPSFHQQFSRIIEFVTECDESKERLRQHYRQYQSLGYKIVHHNIST